MEPDSGVEDSLFGFIHFSNGGSLTVRTSFTINIAEKEERNVRLYGDKRGISVFPFEIYGDEDGHQVNSVYPFEETKDWHYDCIRNFVESCMGRADICHAGSGRLCAEADYRFISIRRNRQTGYIWERESMIYYGTEEKEKEKGFRFYEPERNPDYNNKRQRPFSHNAMVFWRSGVFRDEAAG